MHRTRQEEPQEQQPATYQRQLTAGCAPAIFFPLFVTSRQSESQLKCATAPTACSRLSLKFHKRDRALARFTVTKETTFFVEQFPSCDPEGHFHRGRILQDSFKDTDIET